MSRHITLTVTRDDLTLSPPIRLPGRGRSVTSRRVWLIELSEDAGHKGRGLIAPLAGFSAEGADEVESALARLEGDQARRELAAVEGVEDLKTLMGQAQWPPSVAHGLEQALLNLLAARFGTTSEALVDARQGVLPHHVLVQSERDAQRAVAQGARVLKVKVGSGPSALSTLEAVRDAVGSSVRIHVDVNGAWTFEEAQEHLPTLEAMDVALIEEPLREQEFTAISALAELTTLTLAADESCRSAQDLERLLTIGGVGAVVLKPMLLGGALVTSALAARAAEAGLEVIITHCLDGPMGQASAALAARLCPPEALLSISTLPAKEGVIPNPLAAAAQQAPYQMALETEERTLTYSELANEAARFAAWLYDVGVRPGQTIALRKTSDADLVVALHGVSWLGAVAAPIDPGPLPEPVLSAHLDAIRPQILIGEGPRGPFKAMAWPRELPSKTCPPANWVINEPRLILATSGTTGRPKAVALTGEQLITSAIGSRARLGHRDDDRWLCSLPLHHVGGLSILLRAVFNRIGVILHSRFESARVASALTRGEASLVSLVPTMLEHVLVDAGDVQWPRTLRAILLGGQAASTSLLEACEARGLPVAQTWGMTEAASQVATARPGDYRAGLVPLAMTQVTSDQGILVISGPLVGREPLRSGDLGWIDDEGRVHVQGRRDRIIISGGKNLDGRAIEKALEADHEVAEACVVGLSDETWGERPHALLVSTREAPPSEAALRDRFAARMARYAFPDSLLFVDALPRTSLGKVSLRAVRERLEGISKAGGHGHRPEVLHVDAGVDVTGSRADSAVFSPEKREVQGDGGSAEAPHDDLNQELLPHAHGSLEVGLRVDQGHPPSLLVEDGGQGIVDGHEERLVGRVTVFENAPKEGDASAIDLEEAHNKAMFERHKDSDGRTR